MAGDAEKVFDFLDVSQDGFLTFGELVRGVSRLQGPARSMDLATLSSENRALIAAFDELRNAVSRLHEGYDRALALVCAPPGNMASNPWSSKETHVQECQTSARELSTTSVV